MKYMNLSHYEPVNPHMPHRHREKCIEACRKTFPADDQSAVLAVEPRKRPLGLEARDDPFDGASTRLSVVSDAFRDLGADTPWTKAMAKVLGVISCIRRQHLEPFVRSAACGRAHVESIQQREAPGPFVSPCAGIVRVDNGTPAAAVRGWIRMSLPFRPYATPSPPPLPD